MWTKQIYDSSFPHPSVKRESHEDVAHSAPHWPGGESIQRVCWIDIELEGE